MILCIGLAADPTFLHGLRALAAAALPFTVVDLPTLALYGELTVPLDDLRATVIRTGDGETEVVLDEVRAVWCRPLNVSAAAPSPGAAHRADGQYQALCRVLEAVDVPVLNPPWREATNSAKLLHAVALAPVARWRIPRSCLTNDPDTARAFVRSCPRGTIVKGVGATKTWVTLYGSEHERRLPRLRHSPALLQERIVGPDVRVHVVADRAFAESIRSPDVDYRTVHGANRYAALSLPQAVLEGCQRLVDHTRVPFLGVDFKIEETTGDWYFLEANSMPCYEGYDVRAGGAISRALLDWLTAPHMPGAARRPSGPFRYTT
ncbi:ATP-grasp domain-containing protein [Streptomyces iakyrus]|uniref:ATP-grasp domain-containing protein n=1 Tax=Streptomyces iakyrus TaxID=68219 RepID=UPI0033D41D88